MTTTVAAPPLTTTLKAEEPLAGAVVHHDGDRLTVTGQTRETGGVTLECTRPDGTPATVRVRHDMWRGTVEVELASIRTTGQLQQLEALVGAAESHSPDVGAIARSTLERLTWALHADPTVVERDQWGRTLDLLGELVRQGRALSQRWSGTGEDALAALAARFEAALAWVLDDVNPDWDSPQARARRARGLLPAEDALADVAEQLRVLVRAAAAAGDPQARRLMVLAGQIRVERD